MGFAQSRPTVLYAVPVEGTESQDCTPVMRHPNAAEDIFQFNMSNGERTIHDIYQMSAQLYPNNNYLGRRIRISETEFGDYEWITYSQANEIATNLASGLEGLEVIIHNSENIRTFGIFSINRPEWVLFDQACCRQSITIIPLYDLQKDDVITYTIELPELRALAFSANNAERICKLKAEGHLVDLQVVIQYEPLSEESKSNFAQVGIRALSMDELQEIGKQNPFDPVPPTEDSIHTLCFTSGTTGMPKGAIITHGNFISQAIGMQENLMRLSPDDVHISYLPLSHIMERSTLIWFTTSGSAIGFFAGNILKLVEDVQILRPTIFISVPRLFNRIQASIQARFDQITGFKKMLVDKAISSKLQYLDTGSVSHAIYDRLVFNNVKQVLGGRVRLLATGSAPISAQTLNYLKMAFCCPFLEGFGQTETCGCVFVQKFEDTVSGTIGGPMPYIEFKLQSVPDMKYTIEDLDENGNSTPRGELLLRGPMIFKGYYKNPEETAATLEEDGWHHTGDIAMMTHDSKAIKLIDRKKNIFKLSQGEYVAIEKVQPAYSACKYVMQLFVYGDSLQSCLVAVAVPDPLYVQGPWAQQNGLAGASMEELCRSDQLRQEVLQDLQRVGREAGLAGFEIVMNVHLEPVAWTPDDLLTYTQKLKRFEAREHYRDTLNRLYEELE